MILAYGSYRCDNASAVVAIAKARNENEAGEILSIRNTWNVSLTLDSKTGKPSEITTKIRQLETALATDGKDLVLYLEDGRTESAHAMRSSQAIGGVRIVQPPSYPEGNGAQYATFRTVTFIAEADFPVTNASAMLVSFQETLDFDGGGPRYGHLEPLADLPVKQLLRRASVYRVTQQGSAVGYLQYPEPPSPIWPDALIESPGLQIKSPRKVRGSYQDFPISWTYRFESAFPLFGLPNAWS